MWSCSVRFAFSVRLVVKVCWWTIRLVMVRLRRLLLVVRPGVDVWCL